MRTIMEQNTCNIVVRFKNADGESIVPDSAQYSVMDEDSGEVIISLTSFTPADPETELEIEASTNTIIGEGEYETRIITVKWQYLDEEGADEYRYKIKRLRGH